jgi:hypothetical protein
MNYQNTNVNNAMKKILLLLCFISNTVFAQKSNNFESVNYQKCKIINDTLVYSEGTNTNDYYVAKANPDFDLQYRYIAFAEYSDSKSDKRDAIILRHWSTPLRIYIDKSIDDKIKKKFRLYIKQFSKYNIIDIKIVNDIKLSNYIVKTTDEKIEIKNATKDAYPFYEGITYSFTSDTNNKFIFGSLLININQVKDKELQFKKLKQYFYLSLGNFIGQYDLPQNSMLSIYYQTNEEINDFDLKILKHHYYFYNKNTIDVSIYNKIQDKLRENKYLKENVKIKINL